MEDMRYPIGRFQPPGDVTPDDVAGWIEDIAALPAGMRDAVDGLNDAHLDTPYRPDGWTVRQVVHHVPESHMNCYIRFKWALTEDEPLIKAYDEVTWAELSDNRTAPIAPSLALLDALHARWAVALRALTPEQWNRAFQHPESGKTVLNRAVGMYAWHGRHHVAHITKLREREGW